MNKNSTINNSKINSRKGIFFTIDALFAAILIGIALMVSSQMIISEIEQPQVEYYSKDIIASLSTIKISEINNSYIQSLIDSGIIVNENNTVIEQIGEFYVLNQSEYAQNISKIISSDLLPKQFGFEIVVDQESIYLNDSTSGDQLDIVSTRRLISGIEKFKPIRGATSKVYLQGIQKKLYSEYLYFGGFVGQGNISGFIQTLPSDINVSSLYLELDAASDFKLYINNVECVHNFTVGSGSMTADAWEISHCNSSLNLGNQNDFLLTFTDTLDTAYVGGGFIRVDYYTNELQQEGNLTQETTWFSGVEGIINIYDSFYIDGTPNNITVYLHYFVNGTNITNNTFYVTLGNTTIFRDNNLSGEKTVTIDSSNLSSQLNYSALALQTIPIRAGFENVSFGLIFEGNADVALITDISGSMDWNMTTDSTIGSRRNCNDPSVYDLSSRRLSIAKCLDIEFIDDILNISGNEIGLIAYESSTQSSSTVYPTTNFDSLNQTIGTESPVTGYDAGGGTCICCGINSAVAILTENLTQSNYISSYSTWNYTNQYFFSTPPNDSSGNEWFDLAYDNMTSWSSGSAILGSTNDFSYSPTVVTELGDDFTGSVEYANLWENNGDTAGAPNDFSSGTLNSTANTWGLGSGDDGWDYDVQDGSGPFSYDDNVDYNNIVSGELSLDMRTGSPSQNRCSSYDCSGAYAIEVNVTTSMYDILTAGGSAVISFDYEWDGNDPQFGSGDEVWIKAYWQSPTSGVNYLGSELSSSGSDTTYEIDSRSNPDSDFTGSHSQDITSWVEGTGMYYLVIGGKLQAGDQYEYGEFTFDNIQIEFSTQNPGIMYADFTENTGDNTGVPADFSSGTLNYSGNTFGIVNANDGWDYTSGAFGETGTMTFYEVSGGRLYMYASGSSSSDVSGAYGITVNITQEMHDILNTPNGLAMLSFDWWWDDTGSFETSDHMWVKATWNSSTSGVHYLGESLDGGMDPEDTTNEIYTDDDPDGDASGTHTQSIGEWIEGPGLYYLSLGGKIIRSTTNEDGEFEFDNIQLQISNVTNHYYFRKHFTVNSLDDVQTSVLNILADDFATIYLNGQQVYSYAQADQGEYWNKRGINIDQQYFVQGNNVIAVDLSNTERAAKFDLELIGINSSRDRTMMVMTDGQATEDSGCPQSGTPSEEAIEAACDASEEWGITAYAVGFGDTAEEATLRSIAECGNGVFVKSDNITVLQEFYQDVASTIISTSRHSQTIEVDGEGDIASSILFNDSYISVDYTPVVSSPAFGEISLKVEEKHFDNCTFNVNIPSDIRVSDALLTSYSSEHWTDALIVNGNSVYNLSDYSTYYGPLGDPFVINIPTQYLQGGNNSFYIRTGDEPLNETGCSLNNTFIYTAQFQASVSYSDVLEKAVGCHWLIDFEDGDFTNVSVPQDYNGAKQCYYTASTISYDANDTYDDAMYNLLNNLDFDDDGEIYLNIKENDFVIGAISVGQIPYPWGPAVAEVRVWR